LSFLLGIPGMLTSSFVAGLILALMLPGRWKLVGCALAALAAVFAATRFILGSAQATDIPFAALWAALGAFPGAALGSWLRSRFTPST
jgi:uncharacterized membrane protein YjjP (DUF1212 family)